MKEIPIKTGMEITIPQRDPEDYVKVRVDKIHYEWVKDFHYELFGSLPPYLLFYSPKKSVLMKIKRLQRKQKEAYSNLYRRIQ